MTAVVANEYMTVAADEMLEVTPPVLAFRFDFEEELRKLDAADPAIGLEEGEICRPFLKGYCKNGSNCTFRHTKAEKTVVCKHWLRSLCKKGDNCEFLHQYDLSKMPECYFFSKFGECNNVDCVYLHISPDDKIKECAAYTRGFCKNGPKCRNRHVRKTPCESYLNGFCLDGPNCKFGHPKFDSRDESAHHIRRAPPSSAMQSIQTYDGMDQPQQQQNYHQSYRPQPYHQPLGTFESNQGGYENNYNQFGSGYEGGGYQPRGGGFQPRGRGRGRGGGAWRGRGGYQPRGGYAGGGYGGGYGGGGYDAGENYEVNTGGGGGGNMSIQTFG